VPHHARSIDRWDDHQVERMSQPRDERQGDLFGPALEKTSTCATCGAACGVKLNEPDILLIARPTVGIL
jgi:hypothetical protein